MLTRKCGETICKLLGTKDYNVRITVVEKSKSRFVTKEAVETKWKETFRDSIGGGIIHNSTDTYHVRCQTESNDVEFILKGNSIIDRCWPYLQNVDLARVDITKYPIAVNNVHSWIIVRN